MWRARNSIIVKLGDLHRSCTFSVNCSEGRQALRGSRIRLIHLMKKVNLVEGVIHF